MPGFTERERDIRAQRAQHYEAMKAIMEASASRALTAEERKAFDEHNETLTDLTKDLERVRQAVQLDDARDDSAETRGVSRDEADTFDTRHSRAFSQFLRGGMDSLLPDDRRLLIENRASLDANALSTAPNSAGVSPGGAGYDAGYLIPQGFWANLQIALKAYGGLLDHCKIVETASGNPMPWPTVNPTGIVGAYLTEANQVGFTDYAFGQGMLNAWTITSGAILASLQLINDSAFDVDSFVTDRVGEAIGRKVAQELHTGTGTTAMLGVKTAIGTGAGSVGAGGNYSPVNASKAYVMGQGQIAKLGNSLVGFEDVLNMITYVDPAYRANDRCSWYVNDVTFQMLRSITDAYAHPLWQPNVQVGGVEKLYGYPVVIDQNMPNISATPSTCGGLLFGDMQTAMVVRQVNQSGLMRLTERYADYLQVGYIGFVRIDSRSNDLRAVAQWKSSAS